MRRRPEHRPIARLIRRVLTAAGVTAVALVTAGCDTVERLPDTPAPQRAARGNPLDVPRIMRGTVGSEVVIDGFRPVLVRGYGFVVGLDDTGCRTMPPDLLAHMRQELERRGIGSEREGLGNLSPDRMLSAADTAVVIVEALLPPGAVGRQPAALGGRPGSAFDVRVYLDPRTDATSLDGGRLYTCELRPVGPGEALPPTGSAQATALAIARGPIFVNPFAPQGSALGASVDRTRGRILDGGETTRDNPMKLRLLNPSHARASIITQAINTRFPREPGMRQETARGESDQSIEITVPISHREDPDEFIKLLRHMTIRQTNPESVAATVARIARDDPAYAPIASARWQALGRKSIPTLRDFYESPDLKVRLSALEAGTSLGDVMTVPSLIESLETGDAQDRRIAVRLLGSPLEDPRIDFALAEALDDDDVEVRLGAYESLNERGSLLLDRAVIGEAFLLDIVESSYPMVYVAQVGTPRIVLFGGDATVDDEMVAEIWGGRLIMKSDEVEEAVEIFYRPAVGAPAIRHRSPQTVRELIHTFGRSRVFGDDERPGLGLTYAETIGALYELRRQGVLGMDFRAEQDRVQAAILRQLGERGALGDRPDFAEESAEDDSEGAFDPGVPGDRADFGSTPGR